MRSRKEIQFRLRQELGNLAMLVRPPRLPSGSDRSHDREGVGGAMPDAAGVGATLRGTRYAVEVVETADAILAHRFPILGITIDTGPTIDWRRDYLHGVSSGTPYFRRSPYLDFASVGDHKVVWELNRHQHMVLLAQAWLLAGRRDFLDEAFRQLESWMEANPFLRGINWASALEVGFRALSWTWLWRIAGREMPEALRARFLNGLYRHGCFLELNLSVYFSPNTHLLGEAVALHALGALFPEWPRTKAWRETGGRIVEEAMQQQVREDGSHFEQSAYYHVYALDFFLLHRILSTPPASYLERLVRMAEYLDALLGASGILPLFGDDDGGRLFHPYGDRMQFGRATMATCAALFARPAWLRHTDDLHCQCAWWVGQASRPVRTGREACPTQIFRNAGTAVMAHGEVQIAIKAGPFGEGSGGHSHSDVLSVVARIGEREILIDPGTYTYIADPAQRNAFRGSAAHNTVRIDGREQAVPAGPFRWTEKPAAIINAWTTSAERDYLAAVCAYGGFRHRRSVEFVKPATLVVTDTVDGPKGTHTVEGFWHLGSPEDADRLSFSAPAERVEAWRSRALCAKEPAVALRVAIAGELPLQLTTTIRLDE